MDKCLNYQNNGYLDARLKKGGKEKKKIMKNKMDTKVSEIFKTMGT